MRYVGRMADSSLDALWAVERGRDAALRDEDHVRLALCVLLASLTGCAVLSDRRVVAGCQVADGLTTYYALKHGAVESNSLLSGASPGAILVLKLAFAYVVWKVFDPADRKQEPVDKFAAGAISVLGCVPAANNINVIRGL